MKTVVGVFSDVGEAQRTIDELMGLGFGPTDISVVTGPTKQGSMSLNMMPVEVAEAGRVVACGPLADVIRGTGHGALTGSLRYFGLSPELAAHYASAVREGETLESIVVEDKDADRVVEVMTRHAARQGLEKPRESRETIEEQPRERRAGGLGAAAAGAAAAAAGAAAKAREAISEKLEGAKGAASGMMGGAETSKREIEMRGAPREHFCGDVKDEERRIPVMREELHVGKREVERGHTHVSVHVTERPFSERINLREEHVEVERRTVNRAPLPDETALRGEEIDITEYAEEPVVSKEVRVVEEITVHKRVTGHDEVITDKLRSTEVEIAGDLADQTAYRKYFDSLGASGGSYDEHRAAFDLGRNLQGAGAGRNWEDIEATARERWEAKRPGTWDRYRDSIRFAWARRTSS